ncbi:hypothetical protein LIER_14708 [Lithospermum erythrorhizon]|uniref:Uncharacterized protein n=1 Tax=Lithospermum erythrorhizon TaxID=34254 RepID=A0AAV3Q1Q3_LITER
MKVASSSKKAEEPRDQNVYTLQIPEESPKKGRPHEEVQNVPFDEEEPAKCRVQGGGLLGFLPGISSDIHGRGAHREDYIQIGRNMKIYVDNMLIKSWEAEDHEANLKKSFKNLRKNTLSLNPDKCICGVNSGKLL